MSRINVLTIIALAAFGLAPSCALANAQQPADMAKSAESMMPPAMLLPKYTGGRLGGWTVFVATEKAKEAQQVPSACVESAQLAAMLGSMNGFRLQAVSLGTFPLGIHIVAEDVTDSAEFQLGASEVITNQFAGVFKEDPSSNIVLHIGGTSEIYTGAGPHSQYVDVSIETAQRELLVIGPKGTLSTKLSGQPAPNASVNFQDAGSLFQNYSVDEKTEHVKALVYKVLSAFRESIVSPSE